MAVVGVAASAAGLLSLAIQLGDSARKLKTLYDSIRGAPAKLEDAVSELSMLESFLSQRASTSWQLGEEGNLTLDIPVKRLEKQLAELAELVAKLESRMSRSRIVGKLSVSFHEPDIQKLWQDIEREKTSLLSICQMHDSATIQSRLEEQQRTIAILTDTVALQALALGDLERAITTRAKIPGPAFVVGSTSLHVMAGKGNNKLNAAAAQAPLLSQAKERLPIQDGTADSKKSSTLADDAIIAGQAVQQPWDSFDASGTRLLRKDFWYSTFSPVTGPEYCGSSSHFATRGLPPALLANYLRQFYVDRRPSPLCRQSTCRKCFAGTSSGTSFLLRCWPVQRMISLRVSSFSWTNVNISLYFPKIVASDALIFHFPTTGNVEGTQGLLQDGLASPDDIKYDGGYTPLHYAIQAGSLDVCRLLIRVGGKLDLQTGASKTALDLAMERVLTRPADADAYLVLVRPFDFLEYIESRQFSPLHELILGLRNNSVAEALAEYMGYIDAQDAGGRTPISWAAQMGDYEAVSTLMVHFANVNLADHSGMTPLHYAAMSDSLQCLILLLDADADASAKDKDRGWTPLHYAAFHQTDSTWVEKLLAHNVDVDITTDNLKTPLTLALMRQHAIVTETLIKHGARIDVKGADGFTPLNATIISNSSACMPILLDAGVSLDEVARKGRTMLHLIAQFADEKMIDCLMRVDLACLNLYRKDEAGLCAQDLFKARRTPAPPQVARAFTRLCWKIRKDRAARGG